MSNLLYRCAITNPKVINSLGLNEFHEALLRLYGPAHKDTEIQLEIFKKLAQENLGPKLYAVFDGGRLEEFLPSTSLTNEEMLQTDISAVIATKLALVHKLQFDCLDKRPNWLVDMYSQQYDFILNIRNDRGKLESRGGDPLSNIPLQPDVLPSTKVLANQLLDMDFGPEIEFMTKLLNQLKGPVVFSHNDLHQNNIILLHKANVLDSQTEAKGASFDDRIVLIDFEYSSYNYRTFDLGNHLGEWCFDYNEDKYPYFKLLKENYPTDERQRQFLRHYLGLEARPPALEIDAQNDKQTTTNGNKRAEAINGNGCGHDDENGKEIDDDNSSKLATTETTAIKTDKSHLGQEIIQNDENNLVEQLFNEMQPFLMASNLLWAMWAIQSACTSKINFGYWVSLLTTIVFCLY